MALKLAQKVSRQAPLLSRQMSAAVHFTEDPARIGTREIVGYGVNGSPTYLDREDIPMPAIRFREEDSTIKAIREKEKGDWKKLTIEEKKALYRFSYCQTFAEIQAPTSDWKTIIGWTLIGCTITYVSFMLIGHLTPVNPKVAKYYEYDNRLKSMQRRLDMGVNRNRVYAPYWDLEKRNWKEAK